MLRAPWLDCSGGGLSAMGMHGAPLRLGAPSAEGGGTPSCGTLLFGGVGEAWDWAPPSPTINKGVIGSNV